MISTTASLLPTNVIIEWAHSDKAPPEWRIYKAKGTSLYTFSNWVGATFLLCYVFAIFAPVYGIVQLLLPKMGYSNPALDSLLPALPYVVTFIVGILLIFGMRILFKALQQFWRTMTKSSRSSPFIDHLQKAPWWFYLTYLASVVGFIELFPQDWLIKTIITFCGCLLILGIPIFFLRVYSQNSLLILTGIGFIEEWESKRVDYHSVISLVLREDGKALSVTDNTGKVTYWAPVNKYGITLEDIIHDYEQCKAQ